MNEKLTISVSSFLTKKIDEEIRRKNIKNKSAFYEEMIRIGFDVYMEEINREI